MSTITRVLNIARSQLRTREEPRNRTKYGAWYGLNGQSWCDIFISWVAHHAGATDIIGRSAFTPSHAAWFKANRRWGHKPVRGAIAFFDFPDSVHRVQHVGFVESVRRDGRIVTIEGNTSNGNRGSQHDGGGVYRRVRSQRYVVGYGYPNYGREGNVRALPKPQARRSTRPPIIVDGQWSRLTTRALQRYIGVPDDGVIGPATRRALQRKLGIRVDGAWGRVTRRALQRAVGVRADGVWGKQTIRALQRKLNGDWRR